MTFLRRDEYLIHSVFALVVKMNDAFDLRNQRVVLGLARLEKFFNARQTLSDVLARDAARVERPHRQLRAGLADRLSRDYADRFTDFDLRLICQIAPVALDTHSELRFAREHAADRNFVSDLCDPRRQLRIDGIIERRNLFAGVRINYILREHAPDNPILERLDHARALLDRLDLDPAHVVVSNVDFAGVAFEQHLNLFFGENVAGVENVIALRVDHIARYLLAEHLMEDRRAEFLPFVLISRTEFDHLLYHDMPRAGLRMERGAANHET